MNINILTLMDALTGFVQREGNAPSLIYNYLPVALVYWSFRCVSTPKPSELFCLGKNLRHPFLSDVF